MKKVQRGKTEMQKKERIVEKNIEARILAVANSYQQKYYFNPRFQNLPLEIKKEIKQICVRFTEEVGGIFEISFQPEGALQLRVHTAEEDLLFDEIGAELLIKEYQREKEELFTGLELYFAGFGKLDDR